MVGRLDAQGQALVNIQSDWSRGNTTNTPLGSGEIFTGEWEQNNYPDVLASCQADSGGTLYFDFSVDGTNAVVSPASGFAVVSGVHKFHAAVKGPRYFRVRFVNNADAQSYLRLNTYYGSFSVHDKIDGTDRIVVGIGDADSLADVKVMPSSETALVVDSDRFDTLINATQDVLAELKMVNLHLTNIGN